MADKTRERNNADLFCDYGLDERQKAEHSKIGHSCFRLTYNLTIFITFAWVVFFGVMPENSISPIWVAASYLIGVTFCYCVYAVKASKLGVINGITSFSMQTGGVIWTGILLVCAAAMTVLRFTKYKDGGQDALDILIVLTFLAAVKQIVFCLCGKMNDKVLDEQAKETEEEDNEQ